MVSAESTQIETVEITVNETVIAQTTVADVIETTAIIEETIETSVVELIEVETINMEVIEVAMQGPRGIQGPMGPAGPIGDADGALLVVNRLNEFNTDQMKIDARTNLELNHINCGEFL